MFVLFDALPMQTPSSRDRGMGRYTENLLKGLRQARPGWDIRLLTHRYLEPPAGEAVEGLACHEFAPPVPFHPGTWDVNRRYFGDWVAALGPDWVFHPSIFESMGVVPEYRPEHPRVAVLIHDLVPLAFTHTYDCHTAPWAWYADRFRLCCGADVTFTISESTMRDVQRMAGDDAPPLINIRGATAAGFEAGSAVTRTRQAALLKRFGLKKPFILYVGAWEHRKNMFGCLPGYARLAAAIRAEYDFVVACKLPAEALEQLKAETVRLGVADQVHFTGFVTDEELQALYRECRVFFFPSHYEGLGMPVVEAMVCGAPVVCADNSSLPEYAGPHSWYCDAARPDSMAQALATALAEPKEARAAERLAFASSFTWRETAERTARGLERHAITRSLKSPPRPRLAFVAPPPPSASAATAQALALYEELAGPFDIDWVIPHGAPCVPAAMARTMPVVYEYEVKRRHAARPYDLFVYFAGRGREFHYQGPLARRHPGVVVTPDALAEDVAAGRGCDADFEALHQALGFVAQSPHGWRALKATAADAPVVLAPPRLPAATVAPVRGQLDIPADRLAVAVFGALAGRAETLAALERLPAAVAESLRVVLVAHEAVPDLAGWVGRAEAAGVESCDIVYAGLAEVPGLVASCDLAVWLGAGGCEASPPLLAEAVRLGAVCLADAAWPVAHGLSPRRAVGVRSADELASGLSRLARDAGLRARYAEAGRGADCPRALLAAFLGDVIARSRTADLPWRAATMNAVFDSPEPAPPGLLAQWGRLRARVLAIVAPKSQAVTGGDLPAVAAPPSRKTAAA